VKCITDELSFTRDYFNQCKQFSESKLIFIDTVEKQEDSEKKREAV